MVVNHIDKIYITSDAAVILKELEVNHPAAKLAVMACEMQQQEFGDGTNFVVTFAGELLSHAESLIKMGLHPSQIITGYEQALKKTQELITAMKIYEVKDLRDEEEMAMLLQPVLASKLPSYSDFLSREVARACILSLPEKQSRFDVDNIRTVKILGGNISDSKVMRGFLIKRDAQTSIKKVTSPVVAIYSCSIDTETADTKGTVLIRTADQMLNYAKGEEAMAEKAIMGLVEAGVTLVVTGGTISNICLHFIEKHKIMAVKIASKFELKRLARAAGSSVLSKFDPPKPDELGLLDEVSVCEVGSEKLVEFKKNTQSCKLSTIVVRGSTNGLMDDIERAIDDAVAVYRAAIHSDGFLPGAGATELRLSAALEQEAKSIKGLDQYSYSRFAKAFEIVPRILAENSGQDPNDLVPLLVSANVTVPSGLSMATGCAEPISTLKVYDHLQTKANAIRLAGEAVLTVLRIDQIIIAKQSGGPKFKENKGWDNDE